MNECIQWIHQELTPWETSICTRQSDNIEGHNTSIGLAFFISGICFVEREVGSLFSNSVFLEASYTIYK